MRTRDAAVIFSLLAALTLSAGAAENPASAPAPAGEGASAPAAELTALFSEPQAAVDQDGQVILTRRAVGHPIAFDWSGDGKSDILLGCHVSMDTATGQILLLENVGTKAQPRFRWPARAVVRLEEQPRALQVACGCKSSGTPELHVTDYDGDGRFDLVVDTFWSDGVRVLLNTGSSKTGPTFRRGQMLHRISSHGKGSGGGDWTGDGVPDLVFPVNANEWAVYPGVKGLAGEVKFAEKPAFSSGEFRIVGQEQWFDHTPYAWNFSGKSPARRAEILATMEDPQASKKGYAEQLCRINYYWLDRAAKTCTLKGTLATNKAAATRLGIGDLNGDGCMDVLYTGGVFTRGDETRIWVLYGKVRNIPPPAAGR